MSLLSNLLSFSSLNTSSEREERASSAHSRFFGEDDSPRASAQVQQSKNRTASKSLSKMNFFSNSSAVKIDPKFRSLQRIAHSFNIKVRKHYYSFFITLETLKKNNEYLQGPTPERKEQVAAGFKRLEMTVSIISLKQYEHSQKGLIWRMLKVRVRDSQALNKIDKIFVANKYRRHCQDLFEHFNQIQKLSIKTQILLTAITSISTHQPMGETIRQAFDALKLSQINQPLPVSTQKPRFQQIGSALNIVDSQHVIQVDSKAFLSQPIKQTGQTTNVPRSSSKKIASPIKAAKKVQGLIESTYVDSLDRNCQRVYKCCKITTDYKQKSFELSPSIESVPKMLKKQPAQGLLSSCSEIGDLCDKSSIFREFRNQKQHSQVGVPDINPLELSNVVGEPFSRIDTMIHDLQKNNGRSEISYIQYLPYESSVSSIYNRSESNFGSEAVNFKNSLVQERQSMKQERRDGQSATQRGALFKKKLQSEENKQYSVVNGLSYNCSEVGKFKAEEGSDRKNIPNFHLSEAFLDQRPQKNYLLKCEDDSSLNLHSKASGDMQSRYPKSEYSSTGKVSKSFSYNEGIVSRKLKFNDEYNLKSIDVQIEQNKLRSQTEENMLRFYAMKNPTNWKNDLLDRKTDMTPVRDISIKALEARNKEEERYRSQASSLKADIIVSGREQANGLQKKFIQLNKRL